MGIFFDKEDVLEIVDWCFHGLASSYRTEAREMAEEMMESYGREESPNRKFQKSRSEIGGDKDGQ